MEDLAGLLSVPVSVYYAMMAWRMRGVGSGQLPPGFEVCLQTAHLPSPSNTYVQGLPSDYASFSTGKGINLGSGRFSCDLP